MASKQELKALVDKMGEAAEALREVNEHYKATPSFAHRVEGNSFRYGMAIGLEEAQGAILNLLEQDGYDNLSQMIAEIKCDLGRSQCLLESEPKPRS
jgi:hypothetical protein